MAGIHKFHIIYVIWTIFKVYIGANVENENDNKNVPFRAKIALKFI